MTFHAFVDESVRSRYLLCAVTVPSSRLTEIRRLARSLCLPGQRRWHFNSESNRRRRLILDTITKDDSIRALLHVGRGNPAAVRRECLTSLVFELLERPGGRLVIEGREGQDAVDQRCVDEAIQKVGREIAYTHMRPHEEPGLWLPDAIAWAYGAGGVWRRRVQPIVESARDVGIVG